MQADHPPHSVSNNLHMSNCDAFRTHVKTLCVVSDADDAGVVPLADHPNKLVNGEPLQRGRRPCHIHLHDRA